MQQVLVVRGVYRRAVLGDELTLWIESLARNLPALAAGPDLHDLHLVLRQGAGLVRADDRCGAQRFYRGQLADQGVGTGHLLGSQSQDDDDDGGQAFWDGGHREGDPGVQHLPQIRAVIDTHADDAGHHRQCGADEDVRQVLEAPFQRCFRVLRRLHQIGDMAYLGAHTGAGDEAEPIAAGDDSAHEAHVSLIADADLGLFDGVDPFVRRLRFTSERRFVDLQPVSLVQTNVGAQNVTGLDLQHVAGHELTSGHVDPFAAAHHQRARRGHFLERIHGFLGFVFLDEAYGGVDQHDDQNGHRIDHVIEIERDDGTDHQDDQQRILELAEIDDQCRRFGRLRQLVRTVAHEPIAGGIIAQPRLEIGLELAGRLIDGLLEPICAHGRSPEFSCCLMS